MPSRSAVTPRSHEMGAGDREPDALLGLTRLGVGALFVLALANGVYLYLLPDRAATDYAWAIRPPINAAMLGAGYLGGTVGTALALRARRWRSIRILVGSLVVLSVVLLAATVIHEDRFRWDYPPTWLWTAVYAGVPVGAAYLWRLQERASPRPAADARLGVLRVLSLALALVFGAVAVALFLAPARVGGEWPWALTPLLARAAGGWYLLTATALLVAAASLRRGHEIPVPYATLLTWTALMLLLPVTHGADVRDDASSALAAFVVVHGALLVLCAYALTVARRVTTPA